MKSFQFVSNESSVKGSFYRWTMRLLLLGFTLNIVAIIGSMFVPFEAAGWLGFILMINLIPFGLVILTLRIGHWFLFERGQQSETPGAAGSVPQSQSVPQVAISEHRGPWFIAAAVMIVILCFGGYATDQMVKVDVWTSDLARITALLFNLILGPALQLLATIGLVASVVMFHRRHVFTMLVTVALFGLVLVMPAVLPAMFEPQRVELEDRTIQQELAKISFQLFAPPVNAGYLISGQPRVLTDDWVWLIFAKSRHVEGQDQPPKLDMRQRSMNATPSVTKATTQCPGNIFNQDSILPCTYVFTTPEGVAVARFFNAADGAYPRGYAYYFHKDQTYIMFGEIGEPSDFHFFSEKDHGVADFIDGLEPVNKQDLARRYSESVADEE
jgi:hypothetical protein